MKFRSSFEIEKWTPISSYKIDKLIKLDPILCIYGWAISYKKISATWFSEQNLLFLLTPPKYIYPDLPYLLQIYSLSGTQNDMYIDLDTIPELPRPLAIYTSSNIYVKTNLYQVSDMQKYRRLSFTNKNTSVNSNFDIHEVSSNEQKLVLELYKNAKTLRFNPDFLVHGYFTACWDEKGNCIGACGTHVHPSNDIACLTGHLYVAKPWRRYGIGTSLLNYHSQVLSNKYKQVLCDIKTDNESSFSVCLTVGYKPTTNLMKLILLE
jgi:GNAT superfamily N-acetyltransferase